MGHRNDWETCDFCGVKLSRHCSRCNECGCDGRHYDDDSDD